MLAACFTNLPRRHPAGGSALVVASASAGPSAWRRTLTEVLILESPEGEAVGLPTAVRRLARPAGRRRLAGLLAAVSNSHRLTILTKLLEGPATYRAMQKATGLKVGPLYHHVNQLRLAGLLAPKQRDLYRLTPAGRTLVALLAAALPHLTGR